jgi:hypothetical protein
MRFLLKFDYNNWKGEDHTYLIEPIVHDFTFMDGYWMLSGNMVERDGEQRDVGRRTFRLAQMKNVEQVIL